MTTTSTTTAKTLFSYLPFEATREQAESLYHLEEFLDVACHDDVFILRGAAGTGKTSLVKAVVDFLEAREILCFLSAPTGRAAKVLGHKTHSIAHTIYRVVPTEDETVVMERRANGQAAYSVYVVDEASMISDRRRADGSFITPNSLLTDLVAFVKEGNPRNKIVFIGDRYQLAPVDEAESVALNLSYMTAKHNLSGRQTELSEVKRQAGQSPILAMAHDIRCRSDEGRALGALDLPQLYNATAAVTCYLKLYDPQRPDQVVMIGCAKKNVYTFNTMVRQRLGHIRQPASNCKGRNGYRPRHPRRAGKAGGAGIRHGDAGIPGPRKPALARHNKSAAGYAQNPNGQSGRRVTPRFESRPHGQKPRVSPKPAPGQRPLHGGHAAEIRAQSHGLQRPGRRMSKRIPAPVVSRE